MSYITHPSFLSGFEVEWVKSLGDQEPGNFDPDLVKYAKRDFSKRAEAVTFVNELLDGGESIADPRLTPYDLEEYEPGTGVYFKEYSGPTEYFAS